MKFLREKNCRAIKSVESEVNEETVMNGTIGNLIRVIENVLDRQRPESSKSLVAEESHALEAETISFLPGNCEDLAVAHARMLSNLQSSRDNIAGIMGRFNVGDVVYTSDYLDRMKASLKSGMEDVPEDDLEKMVTQTILTFDCISILEDNAVLEARSEGMVLLKKVDAGDLIVERRAWGPDEIDEATLKNFAITLTHNIHYGTTTLVTIDPRIHFNCVFDDVEPILEELEVDSDSAERLLDNLSLKGPVIDRVHNIIETAGKMSLDELVHEMKSATIKQEEADIRVVLISSPEFINSLINDLRKLGIVEGNDRKIRVVK
ncbi:MAG: hypothetical protein Q7T80_05355 [Methanoregula sp.]|nr:hypothetical protein [Methanoregula sp.]